MLGQIHLATAIAAMLAGALVVFLRKGTTAHKRAGWVYVAAMVAVNVTAFMIYDLFGHFGPFHWAALFSLISVVIGLVPAITKRPKKRWLQIHAGWMAGSYVGLLAAAVAESATRFLDFPFGATVAIASAAVIIIGVFMIIRLTPGSIRNMGKHRSAG